MWFAKAPLVPVHGLVDTGTDTCVFHTDWLKRIGLKIDDGRLEGVAIGNISTQIRYFDLTIGVDGLGRLDTCIGFCENVRPEYGILGFYGFLDRFDADFREDYFVLVPHPKT